MFIFGQVLQLARVTGSVIDIEPTFKSDGERCSLEKQSIWFAVEKGKANPRAKEREQIRFPIFGRLFST